MSDKNTRPAVFTREAFSRTAERVYPFNAAKVSAITIGDAIEVVAAPENEILLLQGLTLSNGDVAPVLVTCLSVPSGATAGDEHIVFDRVSVGANEVLSLASQVMIAPLGRFLVFADSADKVRVSGWLTAHL